MSIFAVRALCVFTALLMHICTAFTTSRAIDVQRQQLLQSLSDPRLSEQQVQRAVQAAQLVCQSCSPSTQFKATSIISRLSECNELHEGIAVLAQRYLHMKNNVTCTLVQLLITDIVMRNPREKLPVLTQLCRQECQSLTTLRQPFKTVQKSSHRFLKKRYALALLLLFFSWYIPRIIFNRFNALSEQIDQQNREQSIRLDQVDNQLQEANKDVKKVADQLDVTNTNQATLQSQLDQQALALNQTQHMQRQQTEQLCADFSRFERETEANHQQIARRLDQNQHAVNTLNRNFDQRYQQIQDSVDERFNHFGGHQQRVHNQLTTELQLVKNQLNDTVQAQREHQIRDEMTQELARQELEHTRQIMEIKLDTQATHHYNLQRNVESLSNRVDSTVRSLHNASSPSDTSFGGGGSRLSRAVHGGMDLLGAVHTWQQHRQRAREVVHEQDLMQRLEDLAQPVFPNVPDQTAAQLEQV